MKKIATLVFLSSIVWQVKPDCVHNSRCSATRGVINQSGSSVSIAEKIINRHRWWLIEPSNGKGTILLAFKNFRTPEAESVTVHVHKRNGARETRNFSGVKGNFEVIEVDAWNVTINATLGFGTNTNFTLHYYSDCEIAQGNPLIYPDTTSGTNQQTTCFIITPQVQGYVNRVYFTLKSVALPLGVHLKMTDVHTSEILSTIDHEKENVKFAVESAAVNGGTNSYYVLVELTCSQQTCDYTKASYLASYYAMNEQGIWCIEAQKLCTKKKNNVPEEWCDVACPAFEAMSEQEYLLESGLLTARVEEVDVTTNRDEEATLESPRGSTKRSGCPSILPPENCQCDRDAKDDKDFCDPNVKCLREKGCLWRCIITKTTRCVPIKRFAPIVLL